MLTDRVRGSAARGRAVQRAGPLKDGPGINLLFTCAASEAGAHAKRHALWCTSVRVASPFTQAKFLQSRCGTASRNKSRLLTDCFLREQIHDASE